jgi:hypothetical protein
MNSRQLARVGIVIFKMSARKFVAEVREFFGHRFPKKPPREPNGINVPNRISTESEDIISVIGSRIRLTKRGNRYAGCCPFHPDTVPSLFVVQETQFFFCASCRAEGDAREFVRRFDAGHNARAN